MPYPYDRDREVIAAFLRGETMPEGEVETVAIVHGASSRTLRYDPANAAQTHAPVVAYLTSDDTLMGFYQPRVPYARLIINVLAEALGIPERLASEFRGDDAHLADRKRVPFFGDQPVSEGVPFVIAGPMVVSLYRLGVKI